MTARKTRDRAAEIELARQNQQDAVAELAEKRGNGSLGEDYIKLAQFMILCTLPYSEQEERQVTRRARLGDGSHLEVTFTALRPGVPLPFGADRKLLVWLFDRAIRSSTPFITWDSALEYQREMGISMSGRSNQQLQARFRRISGLGINIVRDGATKERSLNYVIFEETNLPNSITGVTLEANGQQRLPELVDAFGFSMHTKLFNDIRKYYIALPRQLWRELPGTTQVQDLVYFLIWRLYSTQNETIIPWAGLREQFPGDSNPRRIRVSAKEAIRIVQAIWPAADLRVVEQGIWVDRPSEPLLEDDTARGRIRKLGAGTRDSSDGSPSEVEGRTGKHNRARK